MGATAKLPNPALMAAKKKLPEIVCAVLAHRLAPKIDVNERDEDGATALGHVIQGGHDEHNDAAARALIAHGAKLDADEPDFAGRVADPIPLALLAMRHYFSPWQAIFEALGPKKLKEISGRSPLLHEALSRGLHGAAELLVKAGADVNREDPKMGLPIARCSTPASFAMMVANGAKLTLRDSRGRTALQLLSSSSEGAVILGMATAAAQAESQGKVATFKEGEAQGPRTKASDEIAQPLIEALFSAVDGKNKARVAVLWKTLNLGHDKTRLLKARDGKGRTLLHAAVAKRDFALSKRLLARGIDANTFDNSGETPLSLLLPLSHERSERDGDGKRRAAFFSDLLARVDWSARSEKGLGYFETLLTVHAERRNRFNVQSLWSLADAARGDWLALSPDGATCLLSRVFARAVRVRYFGSESIISSQDAREPFDALLSAQIARPEFTAEHGKMTLKALFSEPQAASWRDPQQWLLKVAGVAEANLARFKELGIDPDAIEWAPSLALGAPTLHAAIESWRISGASLPAAGPRARSRSL